MNYSNSMFNRMEHVILKHPRDAFLSQEHLKNEWKKYNYVEEPNFEVSLIEYGEFLYVLKKHVPRIDYLPACEETGLDSLYAHDPVKFTKEGAIILKSGKLLRQPEAEGYKKFLIEKDIPIIGELTGNAVADGGDIIWLDERTLVVGRGYRTNDEAIRQLKEITADLVDEFIVVQLPHDQGEEECLHLMSFISIVDHDLAVVYSRLMPVFFRQLLQKRNFKLIEVPENEYHNLGCNVLALAPRVCLISSGNTSTKKQLEEAGATVYEYKGNEISFKGTGGPTCLTSPVVRTN
ncbi:N-dimethylarginine dimethylaminohydrolase [Bacillus pakistanensis]|uniref:N-dimethylarginine dimethylaminohydrolase n=1 Tax=Rossellomorea pakistanensis TaxID=992288 RepID=A0ABS2NCQ5_9BACI|nr:arginine deiminase family protein [Bacillus pakistanensis]MBM7585608.1 N-dimethylarginine dimethylaminohydrolase [Bacillus pakistanensis]